MIVSKQTQNVPKALTDILNALSNNLTPQDNLSCIVLGPITTPGTANTQFTVQHNLGRVPINYIANINAAGSVYDSARSTWTDELMYLECSAASAILYLIVF